MKRLHGVRVPHHKETAGSKASRIPVPEMVVLPMSMHIGAPAKPIVKAGDEVKVGQKIAEPGAFVSAPIHASVSGKVKKIDNITLSGGQSVPAIMIETDGEQTPDPDITAPTVETYDDFIAAAKESGVVGLGGAGFPTFIKLSPKDINQVEYILINGAECEPYNTSDTRVMLDDDEMIWNGVELMRRFYPNAKVMFGIESNKPECIAIFERRCKLDSGVSVKVLPSQYPQGAEKVLVFNCTGRIVPEGKLPLDVGCIVINCTTLATLARYCCTGMPLVEKTITVSGPAVKNPQNVIAPIGTRLQDLFDYVGGFAKDPKKILYGGPMMGIAVPSLEEPVLKSTNAVLALDEAGARPQKTTACIKCGRCVANCPLNLMPTDIEHAFKMNDGAALEKLKVNICMECGCCSYVCPAKRPLVQTNKLAKVVLRNYQTAKKAEEEAKKAAAEKQAAKEETKEEVKA